MNLSTLRYHAFYLAPLLSLALFVAGCASTGASTPTPTQLDTERAAFTTTADSVTVLDAATVVLVNHNFTITLANERVGLLQTEYVPLSTLPPTRVDTVGHAASLDHLAMRVTVNVEERSGGTQFVQVNGAFQQRGDGVSDGTITRYWLERITQKIADELDASYRPQVTEAAYVEARQGGATTQEEGAALSRNNTIRAVAIVAIGLFIATLVTGVLSPGNQGE